MVLKRGDVTFLGGAPYVTSIEVGIVLMHYSQITIRGISYYMP